MLPASLPSQDCLTSLSAEDAHLTPHRVLLMEGQPDDALTLQRWIEVTGRFDVTVATEYPRSDDLLLAEDWSLIVIDVHEPTIQDVELLRRARATRGWTPLLLLMATDRDDDLARALRASADAVIVGEVDAVGVVGRVFDLVQSPVVTAERRALERNLRQRRLAALVEPLAASLAHELNNKLAPAVGFAELLMHQLPTPHDPRLVEYCIAVRDSAEAAAAVVRQLLSVSRPMPASRGRLDLRHLVRDALRSARAPLHDSGVQLQVHLPNRPVSVIADSPQLKQVVLSLVHNAIDAMEGSSVRRLDVHLEEVHRDAILEVRDSGHGIDAVTLSRIFEPFFTTRGRSGLGLPISYAIVRQHRGDLAVESEPGEGAIFRLRLPLDGDADPRPRGAARTRTVAVAATSDEMTPASADPRPPMSAGHEGSKAAAQAEPAAPSAAPPAAATGASGLRVLIIEDDSWLSALVTEVLGKRTDWHLEVVTDGLDAVRAIEARSFDLVLCDMLIPELSGQQLYDWVAARHAHLLSRMLFMTGDPTSEALEGLKRQGVRWLEKPFSPQALLTACEAILLAHRPH